MDTGELVSQSSLAGFSLLRIDRLRRAISGFARKYVKDMRNTNGLRKIKIDALECTRFVRQAQEVVNFEGRWHRVSHAGLNPLPVQRPIPVWIGAGGRRSPVPPEVVLSRIGRIADGWFPQFGPDEAGREIIDRVHGYAREVGRDPSAIGMEARINISDGSPEFWANQAKAWKSAGATHLSVNTMRAGLRSPEEHVNAIQRFKEAVDA